MSRLQLLLLLFCILTASTGYSDQPQEIQQVLTIEKAIVELRSFLHANPDDADAYYSLGAVHLTAYATGCDAILIRKPEGVGFPVAAREMGFLPNLLSKRLVSMSKARTQHLAEGIRALRAATAIDPGKGEYWLSLGYGYSEGVGRFTEIGWPYSADAFDQEVTANGGDPAFWEDLALASYRNVAGKSQDNEHNFPESTGIAGLAASRIVKILRSRETLNEAEARELNDLSSLAEETERGWPRRAMGERKLPPQPPEITAMYPLSSTGLNTAELYFRAMDAGLPYGPKFDSLPMLGNGLDAMEPRVLSPEQVPLAAEYLAYHQETIRLLREAGKMSECRFPVDITQGNKMEQGHLIIMRQFARLLALQALHAAETGDAAGATRALMDGLRVGDALRGEPLLISQLVRIACISITLDTLHLVLERIELDSTSLREMQSALAVLEDIGATANAFRGEQVLLAFTKLGEGAPPELGLQARLEAAKPLQMAVLQSLEEAASLPIHEYLAFARGKVEDFAAAGRPEVSRSILSFTRSFAWLRNAQTVLAIEQYAISRRAYPENLQALVPQYLRDIPLDPFDGEPLRYRQEGKGYVVYSVADNLIDDGGEKGDGRPALDIAFAIGMAPSESVDPENALPKEMKEQLEALGYKI